MGVTASFAKKTLLFFAYSFIAFPGVANGQLASDTKPADELLVDALLELDELNTAYCSRFIGLLSSTRGGETSVVEVMGYSVLTDGPSRSEFHSWGYKTLVGATPLSQIRWCEALRPSGTDPVFRSGQDHPSIPIPKREVAIKKEGTRVVGDSWAYPELDPFGLVFGVVADLSKQYGDFNKKLRLLNSLELKQSSQEKNGDVVGVWRPRSAKTEITIVFSKKNNYLPTLMKTVVLTNEAGMKGMVLGECKTSWQKYPSREDHLVPETIAISGDRWPGSRLDVELRWEWAPIDEWLKADIDFERLAKAEVLNFREPFEEVFRRTRESVLTR